MLKYNLHLYEKILLLVFKDKKGTVAFGAKYNYAIAAVFIAELLIHDRIEIINQKNKKNVRLISQTRFGDPLLDECLKKFSKAKKNIQFMSGSKKWQI